MDGERGTPSASTPKVSSVLEHLVERPPSPDKELLEDIAATAVLNESPSGDPLVAQKARNICSLHLLILPLHLATILKMNSTGLQWIELSMTHSPDI